MDWSSAVAFVNAAWQGLALVAGVWLAIRIFGLRRSATTACTIWLVAFGLLAALPAIDGFAGRTMLVATQPAQPQPLGLTAIQHPVAFARGLRVEATQAVSRFVPERVMPFFGFAWLIVAGVLLARLGRGYAQLFRLKRNAQPAPHLRALVPLTDRRDTRVAVSSEIATACAAGFLRPIILLPQADVEVLGRDDLARIIAHEYGHIARYDDWTNAAMQVVCAVFFFFPAIAFAARQVEIERERACDDVAIRRTGDRRAYARMLAAVVERVVSARRMATAPGFGSSDVFARVNHALDDHLDRRGGFSPGGILFVLAVAGVAIGMARLGLPRIAHVAPTPRPFVVIAETTPADGLLAALAANGYGRVDPDELVELANHGITAADIIVLPNNDRSIDDLIRLRDHGVSRDLVGAVIRYLPGSSIDDITELADHGVYASTVEAFATADPSLSASDIAQLYDHGVSSDFIQRLAAHGYTRVGVEKLEALSNAGFSP